MYQENPKIREWELMIKEFRAKYGKGYSNIILAFEECIAELKKSEMSNAELEFLLESNSRSEFD